MKRKRDCCGLHKSSGIATVSGWNGGVGREQRRDRRAEELVYCMRGRWSCGWQWRGSQGRLWPARCVSKHGCNTRTLGDRTSLGARSGMLMRLREPGVPVACALTTRAHHHHWGFVRRQVGTKYQKKFRNRIPTEAAEGYLGASGLSASRWMREGHM